MQYTDFLKRNVARLDSQFTKPPMTAKGKLFLPLNSVYHTFEETQGSFASEDDIIQNWKGDITVEPVYGLVEGVQHGKLRTRPFSKLELTNNFFRKNGRFEKFTTGATRLGKTPRLLHVVDYSEMLHGVKQLDEPLMEFHAFRNYWESFFYNVNRIASADKRYHFIKFDTPTVVPPRSVLQKVEAIEEFNITQAGYFIDNVQLLTLSLWRFLAPDRAEVYNAGLFGKLDLSVLDRIHVIFEVGTHYAVMNLGLVASWIKTEATPRGRWKPEEAQIRLLKTMIGFADFKTNTAPAEDDEDDMEDQLHDVTKNLDDDVSDDSTALAEQATQQLKKAEFEEGELKKPKGGFYQKPAPKDLVSSQPNLAASIRDLIEQDKPDVFLSDNLDAEEKRNLTADELSEEDLDTLERVQAEALKDKQFGNYVAYAPETPTLDQGVKSRAKEIAAKGLMTSAELRRFEKLSSSYKDIKTPNGQAIDDFINIKPEETKIRPDVKIVNNRTNILDETYAYSSLKHMDKDYIEKFLDRHVYAMMIKSLQNEGLVVKDVKRKHVKTLMDDYYEYSIKVIPVIGEESTATFRIPKVQPDGTIISNGCRYKMRRQRGSVPICKIAPDEVAMTSYHSKMFVKRSPRVTMSYEKWLVKQVYLGTLLDQPQVTNLVYGNCFNSDIKNQPKAYSAIAKVYISFNAGPKGEYAFNFDASQVDQTLAGEHDVKRDEVICGKYKDTILVMDQLGIVESVRGKNRYAIGSIEAIIGVEEGTKVPRDMIEIGPIAGKEIPLGFLLAYYIGLGNLLETLKVKTRRVNKGQRYTLEDDEFVIKFSDQRLIIKDSNRISTMLLNGFNHYHTAVSNHSIWEFDKRDAFLNVFDTQGMGTRHETRLKQVRTHWVDSITGELLRELNYPTDMVLLLIEAAKLLEHDDHPNPNDMRYLRDRGYERIAGMVYTEMMDSLMTFNSRPNNPAAKFSVHPDKVWYAVTTDQTVAPVEDSNPIHSIKEKTVVVSSGAGGRSSQTMTAETRRYHPSQIGVVSESTVDNSETGTITYLTSNPNYDTIYGTSQELEKPNESAGQCFSESMLLVPGHKYDDPKRIGMSSIQNSSTTHADGYRLMPCRTGFENTIAQRSGDMFSATASGDGVVEYLSKKTIRISYKDGSKQAYRIGRRYGNWSGKVIPHNLVTDLKVGDSVKENDVLFYNTLFFTKDPWGDQTALKFAALGRVAFSENRTTLEDGSAITAEFAKQLGTTDCKTKYVTVEFQDDIKDLLPVGSEVDDDSILCTLLPPTSQSMSLYAEEAANVLKRVSSQSPRVHFNGVIEQHRVYYCGEIEEMSPSLALLTEKSDDELLAEAKQMGEPPVNAQMKVGQRINGKPIAPGTAVLETRLIGHLRMKAGDKLSVGAQMKSVVGEVYDVAPIAEDGRPIDVNFSQAGVFNRMVQSCLLMGAINTGMLAAEQEFLRILDGVA